LHPAIALVPIVPFLPHAAVVEAWTGERPRGGTDALTQFEHWWKPPAQLILLCFGLVNAGVPFSRVGAGTWIVAASLLVGKPVGILVVTSAATWFGLHRPAGVSWRDLLVVGVAAGIGFTVSLFFATAAFADEQLLAETKMGALLSITAAGLAPLAASILGVGRFARSGR
jgi:NhaA family Na+:H+ antiporter